MAEKPEKIVKIMDKNRLTIPKEAFAELNLSKGDYAIVRWKPDKNLIEIQPVDIKPKKATA